MNLRHDRHSGYSVAVAAAAAAADDAAVDEVGDRGAVSGHLHKGHRYILSVAVG